MKTESKKYRKYIVPYVRRGFAATDCWGNNNKLASVGIEAKFNMSKIGKDSSEPTDNVFTKNLRLAGPELVKRLNKNAISQVSPADGTAGKSYDYMPYIEFYEEDLPWRFTPIAKGEQIPPWLMLLALKDDEFTTTCNEDGIKVLTIISEDKNLYPNPDMFFCFAHMQLSIPEDYDGDMSDYIKQYPDECVSRLICHRVLEPDTHYTLVLVPSFEIGRLAGLGVDDIDYSNTKFSWIDQKDYKRQFPVYYSTKMLSGKDTFLDMAKRLSGVTQEQYDMFPSDLNVNIDDVYQYTDNPSEGNTISVPMALGKVSETDSPVHEDSIVTQVVKDLLEKNSVFFENKHNQYDEESDPWIVPPVYGARQSLATLENQNGCWSSSHYVDEVNLQLQNRVAAGLGCQVVKDNQEELVHRAWTQVEQINAANQMIREMTQMSKVNASSSKKIQERIEDKVNEKYAGLNSDAAKKLTLGGRIYNLEPRSIMQEAINEDKVKENDVNLPYDMGQGISTDMLKFMSQQSEWDKCSNQWIQSTMVYRLLVAANSKDLFLSLYPQLNFLRNYSFGIVTDINSSSRKLLQLYQNEASKEGDLTKIWMCPRVLDATLFFPFVFAYQNSKEPINLPQFVTNVKLTLEYFKNKYYTDNFDDGMFLPYVYKNNNKDFGFFMPDFKYKHLLKNLSLSEDCKYIALDGEEKTGTKGINGNTKNTYSARTIYIFPEHIIGEYNPKICIDDSVWTSGKTFHWALHDSPKSLNIQIKKNNIENHERFYFTVDKDNLKIDRLEERNGKFKRDGSLKCSNFMSGLDVDSLVKLLSTLSEIDVNSSFSVSHKGCKNGLKVINETSIHNALKICDTNFCFPKFVPKDNGGHDKINNHGKDKYYDVKCKYDVIPNEYSGIIDEECRQNIIRVLKEAISVFNEVEKYFWNPHSIKFEIDKNAPHADLSFYKITHMDEKVKELKNVVSNIGGYLAKLLGEELPSEEFVPEERLITFPTNDASERNREAMQKFINKFYENGYVVNLQEQLSSRYPVMAYPIFPEATSYYLTELSQRYILPAIDEMPMNTICCFRNHPTFEEAFLAGMNTEMGRELLWREFPTDERGSYFRKFWAQEQLPDSFDDNYFDIRPMHLWRNWLGQNHTRTASQGMTVFVLKGDLMLVYPDFIAYITTKDGTIYESDMSSWLNNETYMVGFRGLEERIDVTTDFLTLKELDKSLRFSNRKEISELDTKNSVDYAIHKIIPNTIVHIPLINIWNL